MSSDGGVWVKIDGGSEPDAGGLVLVNTTTFSAVSSVSVDNCFTSEYENYKLLMTMQGSTSGLIFSRMRASGSDDISSTYNTNLAAINGDPIYTYRNTPGTYSDLGFASSTHRASFVLDILEPALSQRTLISINSVGSNGAMYYNTAGGSMHGTPSPFDGISIAANSGTIAGTLRIYGYRNGA